MGLNVNSFYTGSQSGIDTQALARVKEQILNPSNETTVDVSKLNLSKFNRVSLGTDLYASKTSSDTALQISKTAADFDINLSDEFGSNVRYLNSMAAQSLFTSKETASISIENTQTNTEDGMAAASSVTEEIEDMDKDKKGSNPFSFYTASQMTDETEENESIFGSLNL